MVCEVALGSTRLPSRICSKSATVLGAGLTASSREKGLDATFVLLERCRPIAGQEVQAHQTPVSRFARRFVLEDLNTVEKSRFIVAVGFKVVHELVEAGQVHVMKALALQ